MSLVIAFHRAASAEFIAASAWYENKRQGLARAFMAEIDHCVLQAAEQPLQYAIVHQDIRRAVVRNFPYSVYLSFQYPYATRICSNRVSSSAFTLSKCSVR